MRRRPRLPRGDRTSLRIGGLVPFSTTDYPDHLSAVVFCQGCPWRCGYCHNPHLLPRRGSEAIDWDDVLSLLRLRRGLLDAVVFTGGEATLQPGLDHAIREVRALGFGIGLHTAGIAPRMLEGVLPLVDWVGMDVKAPFDDYDRITHAPDSGKRARRSVSAILASGVDYECRTTVHSALLHAGDIERIADDLAAMGVAHYALQEFRAAGCASTELNQSKQGALIEPALLARLNAQFKSLVLRSA